VAFIEEERLSRSKMAVGAAPVRSTLYCLREAQRLAGDVDTLAFGWDPNLAPESPILATIEHDLLRAPELRGLLPRNVRYVAHHEAHAALSTLACRESEAAVLVIDGRGEVSSTSVYRAAHGQLAPLYAAPPAHSLGSFYSAAARFAGFGKGGEGKLMGLAPYASSAMERGWAFNLGGAHPRPVWCTDEAELSVRQVRERWFDLFSGLGLRPWDAQPEAVGHPSAAASDGVDLERARFASSVQAELEMAVARWVEMAQRASGQRHVAATGGVFLNCTSNGHLRSRFGDDICFHALSGDAGAAVGAAVVAERHRGVEAQPIQHAYIGPSWSDDAILDVVQNFGLVFERPKDLAGDVADLLLEGHLVGWFQGPGEAGPRALGHRSLLGNPLDACTVGRMNRLKAREGWRPFAPSALPADGFQLFNAQYGDYMLEATVASSEAVAQLPAVVHVDRTARVQVLSEHTHARYWELLAAMKARTGHGVVLNTSLNVGPEPIVGSPTDAVRTFYGSAMDALAIGPLLVRKAHRSR
jgi:predicted NodU family carbamoyl transferase